MTNREVVLTGMGIGTWKAMTVRYTAALGRVGGLACTPLGRIYSRRAKLNMLSPS